MSPTSYQAAPPRVRTANLIGGLWQGQATEKKAPGGASRRKLILVAGEKDYLAEGVGATVLVVVVVVDVVA